MIHNDLETPYNRREIRDGQAYFEEVNMIQGLYYNRLFDIAVSSFRWEGLPPSIDVRFMETCLLRYGAVIIFYDDVLGYLALPLIMVAVSTNTANQLNEPPTEKRLS